MLDLATTIFSFYKGKVYKEQGRQARKWPIFKDIVVILLVAISITFPDFFHWSLQKKRCNIFFLSLVTFSSEQTTCKEWSCSNNCISLFLSIFLHLQRTKVLWVRIYHLFICPRFLRSNHLQTMVERRLPATRSSARKKAATDGFQSTKNLSA